MPSYGLEIQCRPSPGSSNVNCSLSDVLDVVMGTTKGQILIRGADNWTSLAPGSANQVLTMSSGVPVWTSLPTLLDTVIGSSAGTTMYRSSSAWTALAAGTNNQVMTADSNGLPYWKT